MAKKFLIVVGKFTEKISTALLSGATSELINSGTKQEDIDLVWVPGCFELPLAAQVGAKTGKYAAVICLGCVIQGETAHFDYVASQAAEGVLRASLATEVPIIFGVLTTYNERQATARAGGKYGNKGSESAQAALQMISVLEKLVRK
jgi:6,7-dimethyl-8-ribityllumazine synthase